MLYSFNNKKIKIRIYFNFARAKKIILLVLQMRIYFIVFQIVLYINSGIKIILIDL